MTAATSHRKRSHAFAVLVVAAGLILAGCGTGGGTGSSTESPKGVDTASPVTVRSIYGDITVEHKPQRIVALNGYVAGMLQELGVTPLVVAASQQELEENLPWLGGGFATDPELVGREGMVLEKVAAYEPDLIIGSDWDIPEGGYKQATGVASVFAIGAPAGQDQPPWQDVLVDIAALTRTDAGPVLSAADDLCSRARAAIPEWQGRKYQFVAAFSDAINFGDGSALECFGLVPGSGQVNSNRAASINYESIDKLDADLVAIWDADDMRERVERDPRYATLPSVERGLILWEPFTSAPVRAINGISGPASTSFLIEWLLPQLEASTPTS